MVLRGALGTTMGSRAEANLPVLAAFRASARLTPCAREKAMKFKHETRDQRHAER